MFFVRHGETPWNIEGKVQGSVDIPLTDRGQTQARLVGDRLKTERLSAIYSSPQQRAWQTAEAIGAHHPHLEVVALPQLAEFGLGQLEGRLVDEIERDFSWNRLSTDDAYRLSLGAEPIAPAVAWARKHFPKLASDHAGESIVFTTHGAKKKRLLRAIFNDDPEIVEMLETNHPTNCSVTIIEWLPTGPQMHTYNDSSHLEMLG